MIYDTLTPGQMVQQVYSVFSLLTAGDDVKLGLVISRRLRGWHVG